MSNRKDEDKRGIRLVVRNDSVKKRKDRSYVRQNWYTARSRSFQKLQMDFSICFSQYIGRFQEDLAFDCDHDPEMSR